MKEMMRLRTLTYNLQLKDPKAERPEDSETSEDMWCFILRCIQGAICIINV